MDFLAIGHVTEDLGPAGITPGGLALDATLALPAPWLDPRRRAHRRRAGFRAACRHAGGGSNRVLLRRRLPVSATSTPQPACRQMTWLALMCIAAADLLRAMLACPLVHARRRTPHPTRFLLCGRRSSPCRSHPRRSGPARRPRVLMRRWQCPWV